MKKNQSTQNDEWKHTLESLTTNKANYFYHDTTTFDDAASTDQAVNLVVSLQNK